MLNKIFKTLAVISLLVIVLAVPVMTVQAAPLHEVAKADGLSFDDLKAIVAGLAGIAILIAALVNLGKRIEIPGYGPLVKDGDAPTWSSALNVGAMILVLYLHFAGKLELLPIIDANAGAIGNALTVLTALAVEIFATRKAHEMLLAGIPVFGHSHSGRIAGETNLVDLTIEQPQG